MAGARPTAGMVLSIIGGLLILLVGAVILWIASLLGSLIEGLLPLTGETLNMDPLLWFRILGGVFGVAFGLIIIVGGVMMAARPQSSTIWGVIVLILSILSVLSTGGFFLGMILGIVGGILGIVWKPPMAAPMAPSPAPPQTPAPSAPEPKPPEPEPEPEPQAPEPSMEESDEE